jgi:hypothetical protein
MHFFHEVLSHTKRARWPSRWKISDQTWRQSSIATCRAYVIGHRHASICWRNSSQLRNFHWQKTNIFVCCSRTWNCVCPVKRALEASVVGCESYFASMWDEMVITTLLMRGSWWSWLILMYWPSFLWHTERKHDKLYRGQTLTRPGFEQGYSTVRRSSAVCHTTRFVYHQRRDSCSYKIRDTLASLCLMSVSDGVPYVASSKLCIALNCPSCCAFCIRFLYCIILLQTAEIY